MNSSKKLIYIANLRLPTEKAYGIQIAKMCEAFADHNPNDTNEYPNAPNGKIDVELIAPYRKSDIKEDFFDYYGVKRRFEFKRIWAPDFYWSGALDKIAVFIKNTISALGLAFYALKQKAGVIYSRDELPLYFLSFFSPTLIHKCGMVFEAHRFSPKRKFFYKRFKNKEIKIVVISEGIRREFLRIGFNDKNILVARDGVDTEKFDINISKEEARKKVGLPLDKKIVMYTGHLFEWKGAGVLLEAARNIEISKYRNVEMLFVFVGGTEYDIEKFKEKAKGLNNVLILGQKPHKDIPVYLKAADVLVLPNSGKEEISRSYTSPLKLFEYLASGRPIVASDLASIREVLNDKNSIMVNPDDADSLAVGIKNLFDGKMSGEELAGKALEDVQNYTWQKRAERILNFSKNSHEK